MYTPFYIVSNQQYGPCAFRAFLLWKKIIIRPEGPAKKIILLRFCLKKISWPRPKTQAPPPPWISNGPRLTTNFVIYVMSIRLKEIFRLLGNCPCHIEKFSNFVSSVHPKCFLYNMYSRRMNKYISSPSYNERFVISFWRPTITKYFLFKLYLTTKANYVIFSLCIAAITSLCLIAPS